MNFSLSKHGSLKNYCLPFLFPLTMLMVAKPALSSPLVLVEVAEIIANVDHAREGIEKVNAIYDSTTLANFIVQPSNGAYTQLENAFISYKQKDGDWLSRFYHDNKIPENLYIKEIPPLQEKSNSAHFFAYIVTNLNKDTCNMLNKEIAPSVTYKFINQGDKINTNLETAGKCEDRSDNQIVILK